jgi:hypothetical protein
MLSDNIILSAMDIMLSDNMLSDNIADSTWWYLITSW